MRLLRNLPYLTATTLAALALGATSASAVSPVEVVTETDGAPTACDPACVVHMVGGIDLTAHVAMLGEFPVSFCEDEYTAEINHDGTGRIINQSFGGPACWWEACDAPEEEWPIHGMEELAPGLVRGTLEFCLQDLDSLEHRWCTIGIDITETGDHHYVLRSTSGSSCINHMGVDVEVHGNWTIEDRATGEDPIEIVHL